MSTTTHDSTVAIDGATVTVTMPVWLASALQDVIDEHGVTVGRVFDAVTYHGGTLSSVEERTADALTELSYGLSNVLDWAPDDAFLVPVAATCGCGVAVLGLSGHTPGCPCHH
jgi:hypothetical protein